MAALEAGIEWLRHLANNQPWDYCVIWKLGDDPSRFIEWGACCCSSGRTGVGVKIKGEEDLSSIDECRDSLIRHPVRSSACKKLAELPSVIPLYSGIHGDVVISERPRWTTHNANASPLIGEPNGTQVLIPVMWGLIELFTTKHVERDQNLIDFISARFRVPLKQESMMENVENYYGENTPPSFHYFSLPHQIPQPANYSSFEGSSTCSSLSNEHQLLQLSADHVMSMEKASKEYVDSLKRSQRLKRKKHADFAFTNGSERVGLKAGQKGEKGSFKSKNLITERNRRKRIKDAELTLRAIVPKITKMDKLGTLVDAADYIKELLETVRNHHEELEALEEEDSAKTNSKAEQSEIVRDCTEKTLTVVEVEVMKIGSKDFLLKIICKQKRGAFSRLIQVIDSLGLKVEDANVTTCHGLVSNVLKVEATRGDVDPTTLKQSLVQQVTLVTK